MYDRYRYYISVVSGVVVLAILVWLTVTFPPLAWDLPALVLFGVLITFTITFGIPLAGGSVSFLPMTSAAAFLVLGLVPAGWAATVGAAAYGAIRYLWSEHLVGTRQEGGLRLVAVTAANMAMHVGSVLAAGTLYQWMGGTTPLVEVGVGQLSLMLAAGVVYLGVNYLFAGAYIAARSRDVLRVFVRSLPTVAVYEGAPLVFAPLAALIYTRLGLGQFVVFALILGAAVIIIRDLASARRRLERRVQELDGLQAVGQALSSSLQIEVILGAIYDQVAKLMPADNFYVALYDDAVDEVSFPLAVEDGEFVQWRSRRAGSGMTEHVLQARAPLLIRRDVDKTLQELGMESIGRQASSWLGVPMAAGDEILGVITVQSYTQPDVYDTSHREILTTIAAQAAVAIQNARLYASTDEALARRVQELGSILRTSREGLLLTDPEGNVLAANRALADYLGVAQLELGGERLDGLVFESGSTLLELLSYSPDTFRLDCEFLIAEEAPNRKEIVVVGPEQHHFERTLTPVRDSQANVSGWLLMLRDITEEIELANLRDDMMHMLVHDLRSPLSVVRSGLDLMARAFERRSQENFDQLLDIGRQNADRMLDMVNQLLNISKLESGNLPIHAEEIEVESLLQDVIARLAPLAQDADIEVEISVADDVPLLNVDPALMGRVVNNLLDNAIKFTPDGGHIRVWARCEVDLGTDYVMIGVSDTGPGMSAETLSRLFRKFQQVISSQGRRTGTGLGLPFCKLAVEAHGGRIWAESELGKGTTFVMLLPRSSE